MDSAEVRLEVFAGHDPLRAERLLRSLLDELATRGVDAQWAKEPAPVADAKGVAEIAAIAIPAVAAALRSDTVKTVLVEFIRRDHRPILRASRGSRTVEITGEPTPAMLEALDKVIGSGPEDGSE